MIARRIEELLVFQKAMQLADAITAILALPGFAQELRLRNQLRDAADSVVANIAEGFPQSTDRGFARYLYVARGSLGEVRAWLELASRRDLVPPPQAARADGLAEETARMTTALIKYLLASNRRDRGTGQTLTDDG